MGKPKISVVTVCYNAVKDIEKTILSVINQTYPNVEYLIIDGGSTDGTMDVVNKYRDNISVVVSEPDKGIYDAMNKGVKMATGDYLIFMGADDVFYDNEVIAHMASKMVDSNSVYYGSVIFKQLGVKHWGKFNRVKWAIGNVCHQAIFYPRAIYSTHSYDVRYKVFADYAYNLNLLKEKVKFRFIDIITALYNMEGVSARLADDVFKGDYKELVSGAVGLPAYYYGVCFRMLRALKQSLFR